MFNTRTWVLFVCCFLWCLNDACAEIEARLSDTVTLGQALVDMDVSNESRMVYCLTEKGQVAVYDSKGKPQGQVDVGTGFDRVRIGPGEDALYLSNSKQGTVSVFDLAFIQDITTEGSPFLGPPNAPVVLVMFMDFQCPYCVKLHSIVENIRKEFPKDVKVVLKHFPLSGHKFAMKAAQASMAAHAQGKFWDYLARINADYRNLSDKKLEEFRDALTLDKAQFDTMMNASETVEKINRDRQEGIDAGVKATPTVFVNGRKIKPLSYDSLKKTIETILKDKKK